MATWHQQKNRAALTSLWTPEPGKFKCITDKPGQTAGAMVFATLADAQRYCANTGATLIPPPGVNA